MGALALTHKPAYREPVRAAARATSSTCPYGDVEALRAAVDETVAAVVLEPIQGEAGVVPAPDGYLAAARELTTAAGALLVLDEVQTGIGRTGAWFAHTRHGVVPGRRHRRQGARRRHPDRCGRRAGRARGGLLGAGQHGTTYGGNPVSSAAGLAVLHAIERDGLLANVPQVGGRLRDGVAGPGPPAGRRGPRRGAAARRSGWPRPVAAAAAAAPWRPASSSTP